MNAWLCICVFVCSLGSGHMVQYKLYYFGIRGLGEPIRQIFEVADVPYEDIRISRENDWPKLKNTSTFPFGKLPVLYVDDKPIPQSFAIARYLARQFGLAGKDAFDEAWVDALADQYKDYFEQYGKFARISAGFEEGDKDKAWKEFVEPARDIFYPIIEKTVQKTGTGYLVGNGLTWVDLVVSEHVATFNERFPGSLDRYPKAIEYAENIRKHPRLAEWIKKRPVTPF